MNYSRRRYTARYGRSWQATALKWGLAAALPFGGVAAMTYIHHLHHTTPAAFILDGTQTANESGAALSAGMLQMLDSAGSTSNDATAYVAPRGGGQPDVIPLTPYLPNEQVDHGPTRTTVLNANVAAAQRAVERQAAQVPFDLLVSMNAAIKAVPPPATLIVISSGLSTAGGFDLRQVGWDARPSWVAAQLKARGLLPDLAGYHVVFSGLGNTAGRQPALPLPQQTTLTRYWLAICHAANAASCSVDNTSRPELAPRSTIPVPVVPVPRVHSVHGPRGITTTTLPDTLLFPFDSVTLVPAADTILRPVAQWARTQDLMVSIKGYASPDGGTNAYNLNLSTRRADAVAERLVVLGLSPGQITKVTGESTAGQSPAVCLVRGHLDETICGELRRVVIVLSPASQRRTWS
ncbi:MAG: OmpA family protein [Streptosporangiaceae bacterium]|jgi:outer membrane protein OmpA-like peptidoglycan-associated protein